eukprot:CAMPEP_0182473836 /NCGR_PEP_ID=MMETSP1319-20130603/24636_1 /TAXON_ID=172717 /ORGANISM="Bolidomonas pacifica, Strain RCC208" /LENGTH=321 /DNA_ID=CAMNT_0024674671 /DNA_START=30 /DNA_END=992 /DNA_ORIENTATION=+
MSATIPSSSSSTSSPRLPPNANITPLQVSHIPSVKPLFNLLAFPPPPKFYKDLTGKAAGTGVAGIVLTYKGIVVGAIAYTNERTTDTSPPSHHQFPPPAHPSSSIAPAPSSATPPLPLRVCLLYACVTPSLRSRGYGSHLLSALEALLPAGSQITAVCETGVNRWYEGNGYKQVRVEGGYYRGGKDGHVMTLKVGADHDDDGDAERPSKRPKPSLDPGVRRLVDKMSSRLPAALSELEAVGRKSGHWAWWAFPTTKKGDNEPPPATCVEEGTAWQLVEEAPKVWREVLEKICRLVEVNGMKFHGVLPSRDVDRVRYFVKFW